MPAPVETQASQMIRELNRINPFINNPRVQQYLHFLSNSDLQRDALALFHSPRRMSFLLWELGWVLFMMTFKVWRLTKAKGFWSMLYTQLWTFVLFLAGILYIVPRLVFGQAYLQFLHSLIAAL